MIFARVSPLALPITCVSTTQTAACGKFRSSSWEEEDRTLMIQNAQLSSLVQRLEDSEKGAQDRSPGVWTLEELEQASAFPDPHPLNPHASGHREEPTQHV